MEAQGSGEGLTDVPSIEEGEQRPNNNEVVELVKRHGASRGAAEALLCGGPGVVPPDFGFWQ